MRSTDWPGTLSIRTLGGTEYVLKDLASADTVAKVLTELGHLLQAAPCALHLVVGHNGLEPGQTLHQAGLAIHGASAVVMRRAFNKEQMHQLFADLCSAMTRRNAAESRQLVDAGAGFDAEGNLLKTNQRGGGCSMLNLAIREKLVDLALHVIAKGVDLEVAGDNNRRPLMQAVLKRLDSVAEALLDAGADSTVRDYNGQSAAAYALRQHNDGLSSRLLGALPPEEQQRAFLGMAPSLEGLDVREGQMLDLLGCWSPLLLCCASGMPQTAAVLLAARAEVNCHDGMGRTPLHYAHARGLADLAADLVANGADEAARDDSGWLPKDGVHAHPVVQDQDQDQPRRCIISRLF